MAPAPLPRPTPAAVDRLRAALDRAVGPSKVLTAPEACAAYGGDESEIEAATPDAVVLASTPEDIARTLATARELEVPVTPRGGGSGKSGGAVPLSGGVVLSTVGLCAIKDIDRREMLAVVEPGLVLAELHAAVEAEGLFYPPDPNSLDVCALGGNLAENAGGPRAFKYGVTREYVLGVEAILPDGTVLRTGRRTPKGVAGYDVTALLVGSEGTLGVFTEATLRLRRKPPAVATVLALFPSVGEAAAAVSTILALGIVPRCLELLDAATLEAVRAHGVAVGANAGAMLLVEVDGEPAVCELELERVGNACAALAAEEVLAAQDEGQRARLWTARRRLSAATRAMARFKISEDVVVPRTRMVELLAEVEALGGRARIRTATYGHAGDGNLHVNLLWDDPDAAPRVRELLSALFRAVVRLGGTLTGEHGIGATKAEYLPIEQSASLIALQRRIKALFDPRGLLNPGKIFPTGGHRAC